MRARRESMFMHVPPVELALAILGEEWESTESLEGAIRAYAEGHFQEPLVVGRSGILRHYARFKARHYSRGATAAVAMARAFVRRWVEYRLRQKPPEVRLSPQGAPAAA